MIITARLTLILMVALSLRAETGHDAWLRYAPVAATQDAPAVVTTIGDSTLLRTARQELVRGLRGMTGKVLRFESGMPKEDAIVLGTLPDLQRIAPQLAAR